MGFSQATWFDSLIKLIYLFVCLFVYLFIYFISSLVQSTV